MTKTKDASLNIVLQCAYFVNRKQQFSETFRKCIRNVLVFNFQFETNMPRYFCNKIHSGKKLIAHSTCRYVWNSPCATFLQLYLLNTSHVIRTELSPWFVVGTGQEYRHKRLEIFCTVYIKLGFHIVSTFVNVCV